MHRIYFDTFIPANYEKLVKDVMGDSYELLSIREEDANNIFEKVLSLNEMKYKHPLGDILIKIYGLSDDAKKVKEVACEHDVGKVRIYQLVQKAFRFLRHPKRNGPFKMLSRKGLEEKIEFLRKKLNERDAELAEVKEELRKMKYKEKHGDNEVPEIIPWLQKFEEMALSLRLINSLHNARIDNLSELVNKKKEEVASIKGIGRKTFREIEELLREFDLHFAD